jgi:hypothetical protein
VGGGSYDPKRSIMPTTLPWQPGAGQRVVRGAQGNTSNNVPMWEPKSPDDLVRDGVAHPQRDEYQAEIDSEVAAILACCREVELSDITADDDKINLMLLLTKKSSGAAKARVVARGDLQPDGSFWDSNAPTPETGTILLFMAVCAGSGMTPKHWDMSKAFLHDPADVDNLYIRGIPGVKGVFDVAKAYRVVMNIYGLIQAMRVFVLALWAKLLLWEGHQTSTDLCLWLFVYIDVADTADGTAVVMLLHHVDDVATASASDEAEQRVITLLQQEYEVTREDKQGKDGVTRAVYTGMNVEYTDEHIKVHMGDQIVAILATFGFSSCNSLRHPGVKGYVVDVDNKELDDSELAVASRSAVGGLNFIAKIRHDILGQLHALMRKAGRFDPSDTAQLKNVFRYLKHDTERGQVFRRNMPPIDRNKIHCYVDARFLPVGRSTCCALVMLNGGVIDPKVCLASKDTDSAPSAELDAAHMGAQRMRPMRDMLAEVGLPQPGPTPIFVDNAAVLTQVDSITGKKKGRPKHAKANVCRVLKESGEVVWKKVAGSENKADLGTKPYSEHFAALTADMG